MSRIYSQFTFNTYEVNANIGLNSCALDMALSKYIQKEIISEYLLSKDNTAQN